MLSSGRDKPSTLPQSPINAEESDDDEINLVSWQFFYSNKRTIFWKEKISTKKKKNRTRDWFSF